MKIKAAILLLLVLTLRISAQQKNNGPNQLDFNALETKINQALSDKKIPSLVVAVSRNGKTIYEKAFGYADVGKNIKATTNTSYQLASISKSFTATAILVLHERGIINIDSPVTKYVPELTLKKADPRFNTPTVRQVLNHTSGLGTYFDMGYADENYLFDNFENGWKRYGTIFYPPGTICEYSNLGYGLLDRVNSNVSGKSYADFMDNEIFKPLQLHETFVAGYGHSMAGAAKKYGVETEELPQVTNNTTGAGNIYTSVNDLISFGNYHLTGNSKGKALLSQNSLHLMHTYKDKSAFYSLFNSTFYGLGWYARQSSDSSFVIWHEGGMEGASSMLKLFQKENVAIAIISNNYNNEFIRSITDDLAKIILPAHEIVPLNEIADYKNYTSDSSLTGNWDGNIIVEGHQIPASLTIDNKEIVLSYIDFSLKSILTENQPLPHKTVLLNGMINKNYFLGTTTGILPATHIRQELGHLLVLKLLKSNNALTGTITAIAAAEREYYAYPFFIDLKRRQ